MEGRQSGVVPIKSQVHTIHTSSPPHDADESADIADDAAVFEQSTETVDAPPLAQPTKKAKKKKKKQVCFISYLLCFVL